MSTTKARLLSEMKEAMKSGDKDRLGVIRMLITEVKNAEINDPANPGKEKPEESVVAVIAAYHKSLSKTLQEYPADRQEALRRELRVVEDFLPRQMSSDDVRSEIRSVLTDVPERNFGALMKILQPRFAGRADGKTISEALKAAVAEA